MNDPIGDKIMTDLFPQLEQHPHGGGDEHHNIFLDTGHRYNGISLAVGSFAQNCTYDTCVLESGLHTVPVWAEIS